MSVNAARMSACATKDGTGLPKCVGKRRSEEADGGLIGAEGGHRVGTGCGERWRERSGDGAGDKKRSDDGDSEGIT